METTEMIYWTDGGATPNPGTGGYAVVEERGKPLAWGGWRHATSNRMEMLAVLNAVLAAPRDSSILIVTDSRVVTSILDGGGGDPELLLIGRLIHEAAKGRNIILNYKWAGRDSNLAHRYVDMGKYGEA